jgi:hypothetical protein
MAADALRDVITSGGGARDKFLPNTPLQLPTVSRCDLQERTYTVRSGSTFGGQAGQARRWAWDGKTPKSRYRDSKLGWWPRAFPPGFKIWYKIWACHRM